MKHIHPSGPLTHFAPGLGRQATRVRHQSRFLLFRRGRGRPTAGGNRHLQSQHGVFIQRAPRDDERCLDRVTSLPATRLSQVAECAEAVATVSRNTLCYWISAHSCGDIRLQMPSHNSLDSNHKTIKNTTQSEKEVCSVTNGPNDIDPFRSKPQLSFLLCTQT